MSVIAPLGHRPGLSLAWPRAAQRAVAVFLAAVALSWAALVNGQPFVHPDTIAYVRGPDVAVMKLAGERFATRWALNDPGSVDQRAFGMAGGHAASFDDDEVLGGRSIYYGVLTYLGMLAGGFWLTVLVQGLGLAVLTDITLRALRKDRLVTYALVIGVLAALTPAPLFVGFLMPDIWAGLALGAAAALIGFTGRLKLADALALTALIAFGAVAHNSALLTLAALAAVSGAAWFAWRRSLPDFRPALSILVAVIALALTANALFSLMVRETTGRPPLMPPFVTARIQADGPGARFIHERCSDAFAVCRFKDRLPLTVDDFLWATEPDKHVFELSDSATRRALSEEQGRFALAVAAAYPLEQLRTTLANAVVQFGYNDLKDFGYRAALRADLQTRIPEPDRAHFQGSVAFAEGWPLHGLQSLHMAVALAALFASAALIATRPVGPTSSDHRRAMLFFALVLAAVALNAGVCGALSALNGRYQARVLWVLPLAAMLLAATSGRLGRLGR